MTSLFPDGLRNDPWISVSTHEIAAMLHVYDTHPVIRAAASVQRDAIYNGGVLVKRKNEKSEAHPFLSRVSPSQSEHDRIADALCEWGKQSDRYMDSVGFCATVSPPYLHDEDDVQLYVLDLTMVECEFLRDPLGRFAWRFFVDDSMAASFANTGLLKAPYARGEHRAELANVVVCVSEYPDANGSPKSIIRTLMPDVMYEQHLLSSSTRADKVRALATLVTQKPEKKEDRNAVVVPLGAGEFLGNGLHPHPLNNSMSSTSGVSPIMMHESTRLDDVMLRAINGAMSIGGPDALSAMQDSMRQTSAASGYTNRIQLEEGRVLAGHTLPVGPENVLAERDAMRVRFYAAFNIPINMVDGKSNSASSSHGSSASKGASQGASGASNVEMICTNGQRMKQKNKARDMERIYSAFFHPRYMRRTIHRVASLELRRIRHEEQEEHDAADSTQKKRRRTDVAGHEIRFPGTQHLVRELEVTITIASLPNMQIVDKLYSDGFLNYAGAVRYSADRYNIPVEYFNPTPALSLNDIHCISSEPTGTEKKPSQSKPTSKK